MNYVFMIYGSYNPTNNRFFNGIKEGVVKTKLKWEVDWGVSDTEK
jgi:hypothetical protein